MVESVRKEIGSNKGEIYRFRIYQYKVTRGELIKRKYLQQKESQAPRTDIRGKRGRGTVKK